MTIQKEQSKNWIKKPLRITEHARLLGHSVLGRSTGRLEAEMLLKFKVVLSPVRSKPGTCERGQWWRSY